MLICFHFDNLDCTTMTSLKCRSSIHDRLKLVHDAFDHICDEYAVERVASSGTSYVAVAGSKMLHNTDHVVLMSRFTIACQKVHNDLIPYLIHDKSYDKISSLRFGIHTGPLCETAIEASDSNASQFTVIPKNIVRTANLIQRYVRGSVLLLRDLTLALLNVNIDSLLFVFEGKVYLAKFRCQKPRQQF
jgi:Adenylate and Guanylate cyclase catalytic domain